MKSGSLPPLLTAAVLAGAIMLAGGCTAKPHRMTRAPYPPAPVAGADEILRRQQVEARARELINSGKYKTTNDARRAAEREYPAAPDPAAATWSAEQAQWERQKAAQEKFEADLARANRAP